MAITVFIFAAIANQTPGLQRASVLTNRWAMDEDLEAPGQSEAMTLADLTSYLKV
jgi:hypothetical protein